jgi:hypothetical protein
MRMSFDFKEKFDRSGNSSLSGTIGIDPVISWIHLRNTSQRFGRKTTVRIARTFIGERPHLAGSGPAAFGWF